MYRYLVKERLEVLAMIDLLESHLHTSNMRNWVELDILSAKKHIELINYQLMRGLYDRD